MFEVYLTGIAEKGYKQILDLDDKSMIDEIDSYLKEGLPKKGLSICKNLSDLGLHDYSGHSYLYIGDRAWRVICVETGAKEITVTNICPRRLAYLEAPTEITEITERTKIK